MDKRPLGHSGPPVSTLGLGTNNFGLMVDYEGARKIVHKSIDVGITFFDTADIYGGGLSEEYLGRALGSTRQEVVISTKVGITGRTTPPNASRSYIFEEVDRSLKRLGTDYIDLYQIHAFDPAVPLEETLQALHELVTSGRVRQVGCSQFSGAQVLEARKTAEAMGITPFATCMAEYSLLVRKSEEELMPAARDSAMSFLPFFPLASGLLTGKYGSGKSLPAGARLNNPEFAQFHLNADNLDLVDRLTRFALDRGHTLLELAFAWILSEPAVPTVIAGATSPEQVSANALALGWTLSGEELDQIRSIIGDHHADGFTGFPKK